MIEDDDEDLLDFIDDVESGLTPSPLEHLKSIMARQDPTHISSVHKFALELQSLHGGAPDDDDWAMLLELIDQHCYYAIVPLKEATKAAKELAGYMHPKKRSIETTNTNLNVNMTPQDLSDEQLAKIKRHWDENY